MEPYLGNMEHMRNPIGVFHVFHVNRSVNIFLQNRKFFLCNKNMLADLFMEQMKNAIDSLRLGMLALLHLI